MLTEARDIAEELGDAELRAEAMSLARAAFVALCDIDSARARGRGAARRPPSRRRSRSCSTSPSTTARRSPSARAGSTDAEAMAQRSHEWSRLLTGRDASGIYGIQMFSIRREQGRLAELAPVIRVLAGQAGARARGGPGSRRCSSSWAWRPRRGASSRASPPTGSTASAHRSGSPR